MNGKSLENHAAVNIRYVYSFGQRPFKGTLLLSRNRDDLVLEALFFEYEDEYAYEYDCYALLPADGFGAKNQEMTKPFPGKKEEWGAKEPIQPDGLTNSNIHMDPMKQRR